MAIQKVRMLRGKGMGFTQKRTRGKGGKGPTVRALLKHFMKVIFVFRSYSRESLFRKTWLKTLHTVCFGNGIVILAEDS